MPRFAPLFPILTVLICLAVIPAHAGASRSAPDPLFPVSPVLADKDVHEIYPSVAGNFLVYSQRKRNLYSVVRVSKEAPQMQGRVIAPAQPKEMIRFGIALDDGSIGYVSNRMGPIGAWMRQARGDGHVAIANLGTFTGALMPMNLSASSNGRVWAFDSSMEKTRRGKMLDDYADGFLHVELVGQTWRMYGSKFFRYKQGYHATRTGTRNDFLPPSLFIFDHTTSQLTMIPNAFNGAVSPDGRRIVFVREVGGNYDLWMQDIAGSNLVQLTDTPFGEFEPAWSPDGQQIAFVSNRSSNGDVRKTSVYIMDVSNGRVTRLTNARTATDGGPAWKDSRTLLFHSNRSMKKPQAKVDDDWNIWQVKF